MAKRKPKFGKHIIAKIAAAITGALIVWAILVVLQGVVCSLIWNNVFISLFPNLPVVTWVQAILATLFFHCLLPSSAVDIGGK